jgi:iron(III) transport system substrate-binding protein
MLESIIWVVLQRAERGFKTVKRQAVLSAVGFCAFVVFAAFTVTASQSVVAMTMDSPEWKQLIEAAKKEGQLSIAASSSRDFDPVYNHFTKKFGIKLVISYGGGSEHADRILAERRAGIYAVDVGHVGANTVNRRLIPAKAVAEIGPFLVLDEVKEPKNWYGDRLWYTDREQKRVIAHSADFETAFEFFVNPKLVKDSDLAALKSPEGLFDPKWKGKVVALSPMMGQSGNSYFRYSLLPKPFGLEWMEKVVKSKSVDFVTNSRLIEDGLAGGKYAFAMFPIAAPLDRMQKQGLPVKRVEHVFASVPGTMTAGSTAQTIHVYDRAPHPNAAKVFVNWLLSREGMTFIHDNLRNAPNPRNSLRKDVPKTNVAPSTVPKDGVKYYAIDLEPKYQSQRRKVMKQIQDWYKATYK